jgi:hypothetical protein
MTARATDWRSLALRVCHIWKEASAVRIRFSPVCWCLASAILILCAVGTAEAQTTINQTSCIPGTGSCLTNGFLQDLAVDCSVAGAAGRINTALASISDRNGPNRITVTGARGSEGVNIVGFNRLTIEGVGGATITRPVSILDSRSILLKSLTVNLTGVVGTLALNGSAVALDGVTVQSALGNGVSVGHGSVLGFTGVPSLITGN